MTHKLTIRQDVSLTRSMTGAIHNTNNNNNNNNKNDYNANNINNDFKNIEDVTIFEVN